MTSGATVIADFKQWIKFQIDIVIIIMITRLKLQLVYTFVDNINNLIKGHSVLTSKIRQAYTTCHFLDNVIVWHAAVMHISCCIRVVTVQLLKEIFCYELLSAVPQSCNKSLKCCWASLHNHFRQKRLCHRCCCFTLNIHTKLPIKAVYFTATYSNIIQHAKLSLRVQNC